MQTVRTHSITDSGAEDGGASTSETPQREDNNLQFDDINQNQHATLAYAPTEFALVHRVDTATQEEAGLCAPPTPR